MNYNSFVSFVFQNCHVIINLCEEDAKKYIIEKLFCHSLCGQLYHTPNYDWIYFRLYTIWLYTIQVYTIPRFCLPLFKLNEDKNVSSIEVFIMCCIFTFCHFQLASHPAFPFLSSVIVLFIWKIYYFKQEFYERWKFSDNF